MADEPQGSAIAPASPMPEPMAATGPTPAPPAADGEARRKGGCLRSLLIALAVFLGVVLLALGLGIFAFDAIDRSLTEERLGNLTESQAIAGLNEATMEPPDLSQFAYVSAEGLTGPRFSDVNVGEIVLRDSLFDSLLAGEAGAAPDDAFSSYRVVSAYAEWRSSYIDVRRFVVQRFVLDNDESSWETTTSELGAVQVTPLRAPNVREFQDDLLPILRFYNSRLAESFADAHVSISADHLDAEGGTFEATFSKDLGSSVASCAVTFAVEWSDAHGWLVTVESVDDSGAGPLEAAEAGSDVAIAPQPLTVTDNPSEPTQLLACHEGDLVSLHGVLELRENQFVLRTALTEVKIAGRVYAVPGFVINAPNQALSSLIGQEASIEGYISVANAFEDLPLSVMMSSVDQP